MNTPAEVNGSRGSGAPAGRESSEAAEALSLARRIVDLASDKQASDIVLLDIRGVSLIADYFVICTVASEVRNRAADLAPEGWPACPFNTGIRSGRLL